MSERDEGWCQAAPERARAPHYGVCKLGPARFFWVAWAPGISPYGAWGLGPPGPRETETTDQELSLNATATGYAPDRETAIADAIRAGGAGDHPPAPMPAGWASDYHRRLLVKARAERQAEGQGAAGVELLWTAAWDDGDYDGWRAHEGRVSVSAWRVVRRARRRVYVDQERYDPERQRSGSVWAYDVRTFVLDRAHLEREGWATHGNREWGARFYVRREDAVAEATRYHGRTATGAAVPDCLRALDLTPPCTRQDIKRAYRKLAQKTHPDRGGTHEGFLALQRAYEQALRLAAREAA